MAALLSLAVMLITLKFIDRSQEMKPAGSRPPSIQIEVPIIASIPSFSDYRNIEERKTEFFNFLRPFIQQENSLILEKRQRLLELSNARQSDREFSQVEVDWLKTLCAEYRIGAFDMEAETTWSKLLLRVDVVPVSLALVQAAVESGWGTSRFASEGNNLFGQWCFSKGCGMVPDDRNAEDSHEVAIFPTVNAAVHSYFRNLNTGRVYRDMRERRRDLREAGNRITGYELAKELTRYSERGDHYVKLLRSMIRDNMQLIDAP